MGPLSLDCPQRSGKHDVGAYNETTGCVVNEGVQSRAPSSGWTQPCGRHFLFPTCSTIDTLPQIENPPQCTTVDSLPLTDEPSPIVAPRSVVQAAVEAVVASCRFPVTLAEPTGDGRVLMVSQGFEELTGAPREALLASHLRCLSRDLLWQDPSGMMRLRLAAKTGIEATAVLMSRKLTGEYLKVLVHSRGLIVGKDPITGEDSWFLVGMYIDLAGTEMDAHEAVEASAASIACLEEQIRNAVATLMEDVLMDELSVPMPCTASVEPLQFVLPCCDWMPSPDVE